MFIDYMNLQSLGLIQFQTFAGFNITHTPPPGYTGAFVLEAFYFGKRHVLVMPPGITDFGVGPCMLTEIGKELATICNATPDEQHRLNLVAKWRAQNITVTES